VEISAMMNEARLEVKEACNKTC